MLIYLYTILNKLVDVMRDLILFKSPLRTTFYVLLMLALSGIAESLGDTLLIWGAVFSSFVVPFFISKKAPGKDGYKQVKLSSHGEKLLAGVVQTWYKIDATVPKYSDLQEPKTSSE